ncbi:MAG: hypothetical protein C0410_05370 [Anaerolinea sp.]|nr:hypothetical protein [Anaerolinea sp.]
MVFRLCYSSAYGYEVSLLTQIQSSPIQTIMRLMGDVFWSTWDSVIKTWFNLIDLFKRDLLTSFSIAMLLLILVGSIFTYLVLRKYENEKEQAGSNRWVIIVGLLATITAMIPFIAGSFKITLGFPNNRYLIALAPGASLFLAGVIDALLRTEKQKLITYSVLIGLAIGSQFLASRSFMLTWKAQQDFFWQLTWRAPGIKPGTILITEDLPFSRYFSGTSLTAPLNLIYAGDFKSHQIPFLFLFTSQSDQQIPVLEPGLTMKYSFRSFNFQGNASSMLVLRKPTEGCLRIMAPTDSIDEFAKKLEYPFWKSSISPSNLDRIITEPENPAIPPSQFFGTEDRNQWCYYFEKADLTRQQQKWQVTIQLYKDAEAAGFYPLMDAEWLSLAEAYLNMDEAEKALEITRSIINLEQTNTAGFCRLWSDSKDKEGIQLIAEEALLKLKCNE